MRRKTKRSGDKKLSINQITDQERRENRVYKNEEDTKPAYYSVTPAEVRYNKSLPMGARFLYGEITALCNQKGFCWAKNRYFADLYEVDVRTIKRWIQALESKGYIKCETRKNKAEGWSNSRKIWLSWGTKTSCPPVTKMSPGGDKNVPTPRDKNVPSKNNTPRNNTINNKGAPKKPRNTKKPSPDSKKQLERQAYAVANKLVKLYQDSGKQYSGKIHALKSLVKKRFDEKVLLNGLYDDLDEIWKKYIDDDWARDHQAHCIEYFLKKFDRYKNESKKKGVCQRANAWEF
jgi:hypothetical protein